MISELIWEINILYYVHISNNLLASTKVTKVLSFPKKYIELLVEGPTTGYLIAYLKK